MKYLKPAVVVLFLWCHALGSVISVAAETLAPAKPTAPPNILLIVVDDQSAFDLKTYNSRSTLDTPNIDLLAAQGMVLDTAYQMGSWSGAVCTPSRHMIMSGRSVWHIPQRGNRRNKPPVKPAVGSSVLLPTGLAENTLAAVFNRAGYETMRTCKKGNSYEAANAQFTIRRDATKRGGTAESGSAWHAEQVLNYLEERQTQGTEKPFMIYYGFSHPHDTRDGTPELLAKYGATNHTDQKSFPVRNENQPALPLNYLPRHPFAHGHPNLRDEVAVSGVWKRRDEATIRNELGRQHACSENIDIQVGRVLDKLASTGELKNTYVIYTSDHGMAVGRHGLQGKQNLYEHTWRVPYIVMGPGIAAGTRSNGNVYLLDTLATLCDLSGVKPPSTSEGKSFKSVLTGKIQTVRDVLYGVYCGGTKPGMRCVRQGPWKLIKYDTMDGTVRETQLFNLADNPHEYLAEHHDPRVTDLSGAQPKRGQTNLAGDSKYAQQLSDMEKLLLAQMQELDDPYRLWDQPAR
jgi:choline-sulfatase